MLDFNLAPSLQFASIQKNHPTRLFAIVPGLRQLAFSLYNRYISACKKAVLIGTVRLKFQIARYVSCDGLVQLGLMWRNVEPGFGIGSGRHINP
jgi:hypothetical protein